MLSQKPLQRFGTHAHGVTIHIYKHLVSTGIAQRVAGGNKGERLLDHLVVALNTDQLQCSMKSCCSVHCGDGKTRASECCDLLFELGDFCADRRQKIRVDTVDQVLPFIAIEHRAVQGNEAGAMYLPNAVDH